MKISVIKQDLNNIVTSTGETLIILIFEGCLNSMRQGAASGTGGRRMASCSLTRKHDLLRVLSEIRIPCKNDS